MSFHTDAWDFGYSSKHPNLDALYSKAKRLQWDSDTVLDWDQPIDPSSPLLGRETFPILKLEVVKRLSKSQQESLCADLTTQALSQFLHGEQGALLVAGLLLSCCPDLEAKLYAASQAMDEARHVEVFRRYIAKCGSVQPMRPRLKEIMDSTLAADHWVKTLIGVQVVVEGMALATFKTYSAATNDPLLKDLLGNVIRDEARHVGFGVMYVRDTLLSMHADDREAIADFAYDATMALSSMLNLEMLNDMKPILERAGISLTDVYKEVRASAATVTNTAPNPIGDAVVALLDRVGAITERTRPKYERARRGALAPSPIVDELEALR